jgi:hypothetical protein
MSWRQLFLDKLYHEERMIRETSPDKIRGKIVKYQLGDCLVIQQDSHFIGAIMTGKFNKYYNLTFMDFVTTTKPKLGDFIHGRLFGTRLGSWKELTYGVDQRMVTCKYIDNEPNIEKIGMINLNQDFVSAGYAYLDNLAEIFNYFYQEINTRIEKSIEAEKFPGVSFVGKHLIETTKITHS